MMEEKKEQKQETWKPFKWIVLAGGVAGVALIVAIVMVVVTLVGQRNAAKKNAQEAFAKAWYAAEPEKKLAELQENLAEIRSGAKESSAKAAELMQKAEEAIARGDYDEAERIMKELRGE